MLKLRPRLLFQFAEYTPLFAAFVSQLKISASGALPANGVPAIRKVKVQPVKTVMVNLTERGQRDKEKGGAGEKT